MSKQLRISDLTTKALQTKNFNLDKKKQTGDCRVTEGARKSKFKIFSDDYFRVINQAGVRQREGLCGLDYANSWDSNLSPDGILYYAACDESGRGRHARLVAYDYQTDTAKICVRAEDVALPKARQLPATKLHESITFLPDGRVFGTTHTTDRAPSHPEFMPFAHHTHAWEGWPGSTMICYATTRRLARPRTGVFQLRARPSTEPPTT